MSYYNHTGNGRSNRTAGILPPPQYDSNKGKELMISSERTSGLTPYKDGFPSSPQIREKAFQMIRMKFFLRLISIGIVKTTNEDLEIIKEDLKRAQLELWEAQKYSHQL